MRGLSRLRRIGKIPGVSDSTGNLRYIPWSVVFDGLATKNTLGNEASIQNLHDAAFTAEGWFRLTESPGATAQLICKGTPAEGGAFGWSISYAPTYIAACVDCATTDSVALKSDTAIHSDGLWHHIAMTFDDAGDRKARLWIDGVLAATGAAGSGAVRSDASVPAAIGCYANSNRLMQGSAGWARISNSVRYTNTFVPDAREKPPATDANTVRLFWMDEGLGATLTDKSTNAQNGTLTAGAWLRDGYGWLTNAYLGDSITYGSHADPGLGFAALTHAWLPTQKVGFALRPIVNAGIGGTDGWYAMFRLQADVVASNPDVVCVAFGLNETTYDVHQLSAEALIRRLRTALPNARIVFVMFRQFANPAVDDATDQKPQVTAYWRAVCEHYGIPVIDYGAAIAAKLAAGEHLSTYQYDTKHPTNAGHQLAHELVRGAILAAETAGAIGTLPDRLYACEPMEADLISRNANDNDGTTGTWAVSGTDIVSSEAGATISWTGTFRSYGAAWANSGVIQYKLDAGAYSSNLDLTAVGPGQDLGGNMVASASHAFTIKVISGTVTIRKFLAV